MTPAEASAILARITYKPSFRLTLIDGCDMRIELRADLPDADGVKRCVQICVNEYFGERGLVGWRECDVIEAVRLLCVSIEMHEIKEWLKLDGRCIDEPHPERRTPPTSWRKTPYR